MLRSFSGPCVSRSAKVKTRTGNSLLSLPERFRSEGPGYDARDEVEGRDAEEDAAPCRAIEAGAWHSGLRGPCTGLRHSLAHDAGALLCIAGTRIRQPDNSKTLPPTFTCLQVLFTRLQVLLLGDGGTRHTLLVTVCETDKRDHSFISRFAQILPLDTRSSWRIRKLFPGMFPSLGRA